MQVRVEITETEATAAGEEQPRDLSAKAAARIASDSFRQRARIETLHLLALSRVALYLANGVVYWPAIYGAGHLQGGPYNYLAPRYQPVL